MEGTRAVALAAAYAGGYAALHSLLASDGVQALATRAVGPRAARGYRLAYNTLAVALLLPE